MSTLFFIVIICAVGYWYIKKRKGGEGGKVTALDADKGSSPKISDQDIQNLTKGQEATGLSFDDFKRLEQNYSPTLREALEALFGTMILVKDRKLKNGKGDFSDRDVAKVVSAIDQTYVIPAFKGNQTDYNLWWSMALSYVSLAILKGDCIPAQTKLYKEILQDYEQTNAYMSQKIGNEPSLLDTLRSMDTEEGSMFISGPQGGHDIEYKLRISKAGIEYYEMKGAYKFFHTDINPDMITARVELIIASMHWHAVKTLVWRCDIEKYPMPSTTRLAETPN